MVNDSASTDDFIPPAHLPRSVRWSMGGVAFTMVTLTIGRSMITLASEVVPGLRQQIPSGVLWGTLILIWIPGAVGLLISFYTVARYPYVSLATGGGTRIITMNNWLWWIVGTVLFLAGVLVVFSLLVTESSLSETVILGYLAVEFLFAGFLATLYRREKHVTIASFLELTANVGFLLFPLYLPSLIIGSIRCRRFLRSLPTDLDT